MDEILLNIFNGVCEEHKIEHRLTQPAHPWTNGQVERMNKTIKDATGKTISPLLSLPTTRAPKGLRQCL
jgi:transposase InsO family protein